MNVNDHFKYLANLATENGNIMNKYSRTGKLDRKFNAALNLGARLKAVDFAIAEILKIGSNIRPYEETKELHRLYKERKCLRHTLNPTGDPSTALEGALNRGSAAEVLKLKKSIVFYQSKLSLSSGSTPAKHIRKWQKSIAKMQGLVSTLTQGGE